MRLVVRLGEQVGTQNCISEYRDRAEQCLQDVPRRLRGIDQVGGLLLKHLHHSPAVFVP